MNATTLRVSDSHESRAAMLLAIVAMPLELYVLNAGYRV